MNSREFRQWILGEYRPPVEVANDGQGGYLIPHFITVDKKGKFAAFYRWAGWLLKSPRIYTLGTYQAGLYAEFTRTIKKARIDG